MNTQITYTGPLSISLIEIHKIQVQHTYLKPSWTHKGMRRLMVPFFQYSNNPLTTNRLCFSPSIQQSVDNTSMSSLLTMHVGTTSTGSWSSIVWQYTCRIDSRRSTLHVRMHACMYVLFCLRPKRK